jgi:glycosyltransferase involved in cell wall biosynthesis
MRQLYFLLPGTTSKFSCGGLWAELKTLELARELCSAEVVTYRQREADKLFLGDLLASPKSLQDCIFVMGWGFDVAKLATKLERHNVVYHAHSSGYGFRLPAHIPIITVSRNTLGYWGQRSPHALLYYLPNQISDEFYNAGQSRDIDVLVHARKSSHYLLSELVPHLEKHCAVTIVQGFVEDLSALFNRTKVYLYDSAEYWALQQVSEGFGLQPLEAIACGCHVFSSVNGGLSDYLDPGFNCQKIAGYSLSYDLRRIVNAIDQPQLPTEINEAVLSEYRRPAILQKLSIILHEINDFFDYRNGDAFGTTAAQRIAPLSQTRLLHLRWQQFNQKVRARLLKRK